MNPVLAKSGYPPGTEPGPACPTCGACLERDWKAEVSMAQKRDNLRQEMWRNLTGKMLESIWTGSPIFRLADRSTLLVTEELKERLEGLKVTRVEFRPYPRPKTVIRTGRGARRS